jgi:hypothetical protein
MATDPRDKIYGLYGLASISNIEQLGMPVDYHSKAPELYITIASPLLSTPFGLDILSVPRPLDPSRVPGLPSWVPDWSAWEDTYTLRWQELQTRQI